ncbi:MAG: peptidylprolyl isomerase, partial [Nitrospiria bacterium]
GFEKNEAVKERVDELTKELVINEVVNYIIREKVTDAAMNAYYAKNKEAFREVRANHILLKTEDEANAAKKQLDDGADFSGLAKEISVDPASASKGGDLGFFTKERMVEPFADVAFGMKKDEIKGPVKSAFGYHIIQVVDMRDPAPFESLTPAQLQNLRGVMINWEIDRLKEKAEVVVNEERLKQAASSTHP